MTYYVINEGFVTKKLGYYMEGFVDTFHGGNFGHQSQYPKGSDKHIKYLKFWLSSHLQDFFIKKDFFEFYKNLDEVQEEQSKGQ